MLMNMHMLYFLGIYEATKKAGKWYRGFCEAAERFMANWHVKWEKKGSKSRAARMRDAHSRKRGGGSRETVVERKEDGRQASSR